MCKREKKVIIVLFVLFLLIGVWAVQGYGINVDENPEIDIARMNMKEYVRLFMGEDSRLFRYMDGLIGDLMDSVEIDHGEAVLYPAVAVVSVLRAIGRADLGMLVYHMYLYIWFLFGLLAAYQVGKFLTGKILFGVMATGFIGLNPLLFGMAFINNKDMIMLSLASICIYFGIQFVETKSRKWSVLWAVVAGLCVNMRIIGLAYVGLFGGLYLLEFITSDEKSKKVFLNGVLAVVVILVTFVTLTPATWYSFFGYFVYTISSSASFMRTIPWELYNGELYHYLENPLPWHYFLGCFSVRTPFVFLVTYIVGQIGCIVLFVKWRKLRQAYLKYMLIFATIIWIPMIFFMIKGANVTFRHFYFMYPELAFMAVYVLRFICVDKKIENLIKVCVGVQAFICVVVIILNHPFETTYFNVLAGKNVEERFEYANTDYYKKALEEILKMDSGTQILISSDDIVCYWGIKQAWEILHPEKKARIQIAEPGTEECEHADYHVWSCSTLEQEKKKAELGVNDRFFHDPEKEFYSKLKLNAGWGGIIYIYYNREKQN